MPNSMEEKELFAPETLGKGVEGLEGASDYVGAGDEDLFKPAVPGVTAKAEEGGDEGENGEAEEVKTYSVKIDDSEDLDLVLDDDDSSSTEDSIVSAEERMRLLADKILSACISDDKELKTYALNKLMLITNPRLFRDENYILFSVLYAYRSKLRFLNIDSEFLRLFLNRNRGLITKARGYIDIHSYGEVDDSEELGYIAGVCKHFNRLKTFNPDTISEFETNFEKYLIEFKTIEATKAYRDAQLILTDGMKIGRANYFGFDDSQSYLKKRLAEIEGLVDFGVGTGFVKMSEVIMDEKEDSKKPVKVGDFGRIKPMNDIYGGLYTGMFYSFVAPPKSGKTKLCTRLCHTMVVNYGTNVTVWAQEGGKDAWTAQMRAIHFDYKYNSGVDFRERKFGIDQNTIMKDLFRSDELRQLEMSSKLDLASNLDYGVVDFIDRPFMVETFIDEIDTSVKENNSKAVIIDYLSLIGSTTGMNERERIAEAYRRLLVYCKQNNVVVITPGQYKREAFEEMLKKTDISGTDFRSAGGGSSEAERTPDALWALWCTASDLQNNKMQLIPMPSRMNISHPPIEMRVDLGTCQFVSVGDE